ncbi:MAG: radical SAM protein [Planctomycetota bacterium]
MSHSPAAPTSEPRSPVPDLLFEDVCEARIGDIRQLLDDAAAVDEHTPLHRVTVFVTYRCNLRCAYCKTIARSPDELTARPQKAATFDRAQFEQMLASHGRTPIEHLHFTGGEATLLRDLPHMVRAAKAHGVGCVSLTTNGTQPPEAYTALVHAGVDEIRVSLDDAHDGDREASLLPSTWGRAIATVRTLGEMRRAGHAFFLIVNTVVERRNGARLADLVRFLLALGPDDMKLITSVDEKDALSTFAAAPSVIAELEQILAGYPPQRFPLLRRKVRTVFAGDAIGLESVQPAADGAWRCYIPLTERTVDGRFYYPCSVYLREGGTPLGALAEPQDEQRRKTAAFVERGDCLSDPICRRYCLHCTREFNVGANAERGAGGR